MTSQRTIPRISWSDLRAILALLALTPIAWLAPVPLWRLLTLPFGLLVAVLHPRRTRATARRIGQALELPGRVAPLAIEVRHRAGRVEEYLQVLRVHRPGEWRPVTRLRGREHVDAALERGSGALLWVCSMLFGTFVSKVALHREGLAVVHLSRFSHGFSQTRFGIRVLNPIRISAETRYLAERVVMPERASFDPIRRLMRRLGENRLVSITCLPSAPLTFSRPFLGGEIRIPTGPARIALETGATLLPVFTVRSGPLSFETVVGPALEPPTGCSRDAAVESMLAQYVVQMERFASADPVAWMWHLWDTG